MRSAPHKTLACPRSRFPEAPARAWLVMLALIIFCLALTARPAPAADDPAACDPKAVMARAEDDPAMADKLMAYTVEALLTRLRCSVPTSVMDKIRKDPADAELLLDEHDPDCYDKMRLAYMSSTREDLETMIQAVTDALERLIMDLGCPRDHDAVAAMVANDYLRRALEMNYMDCVNALRRVASAEKIYYNEHDAYTDDMEDLAPWIAPAEDRTARGAEASIASSCCAASGCRPDDASVSWDAQWGLELDGGAFSVYGYPIGRPDCLILITPDSADPATFEQCLEESEREDDE